MSGNIAAVLDRIEAQRDEQPIPENVSALALLQMVYRGAVKVLPQQMRGAIESLPYENPKLSAVAFASMSERDFALRLERCIERSNRAKLIEAHAVEVKDE
jgi:hypothetical protein